MAVGFRWMPFGAVALAGIAKPADPPPSEPSPGVEVAPVIAPEPPGSASAAAPQEPSPVASTPTSMPTGQGLGAFRDRARRNGFERYERWVGYARAGSDRVHPHRLPRPSISAAGRRNRDGRLSDHARARIAAAALRNRLEPLNNRSGWLVLSSASGRSILGPWWRI